MKLFAALVVLPALILAQIQTSFAEVKQIEAKPNPVFSDNAVLQRGIAVPVWGTAPTGQRVTVTFQGQKQSTTTRNGRWMVRLAPLTAGGPFTMTISASETVEIKNVLVGEVWLAGGQSNMAFTLSKAEGGEQEVASSADPMLRLGTITRGPSAVPLRSAAVKWQESGPELAGGFSAAAYYFGKELRKTLGCPVGLLDGSRGGTRIEAWMSEEALNPFLGQFDPLKPKAGAESADWNTASALWNGIIAPIIPYPIRGAIWYQGEANAGGAALYRELFPAMIEDWRKEWGQGTFPFLFVQLAPYHPAVSEPQESAWAELRDAQLYTSQTVPNTAMAVITDCGNSEDIHPTRKKPVGDRLALAARALAYSENVVYKGPSYKSMSVFGNSAVLQLDGVDGGLVAKDGDLTGFAVAGEDRKFRNAHATIQGSRIVVSSPEVAKPVAVRFGWADFPIVNLFNQAGLPASPFRTDDFPMVTAPKQKAAVTR